MPLVPLAKTIKRPHSLLQMLLMLLPSHQRHNSHQHLEEEDLPSERFSRINNHNHNHPQGLVFSQDLARITSSSNKRNLLNLLPVLLEEGLVVLRTNLLEASVNGSLYIWSMSLTNIP